ncbi:RSP_2648 family PIN domain-containing protein [Jannaschia aquimarina]|uniref:PIN domain-containing protein n=1 Tax=Jannaschia aquimarina TaxID=935700 RepID=A0A0D1E9R1_9RHOB|nr:PIN domain-containing protein [Jannaschia aquimarina]KIT14424.1 hypothetical protein jaqu_37120 [Jannaschia aquimarina]SNT29566.1 Predicted nucleic acid-binding protein, contains PIN domain [Jannaschia aquimarina]
MRVLLDACVLFPTVLREILIGVAGEGLFEPLWSARILEEWARAAPKLGEGAEAQARGEIAVLRANWPRAEVRIRDGTEARLWLPDPNDIHVLAAAVDGHADALVTFNRRDFPRPEMEETGIALRDPDGFLMDLWLADAAAAERVAGRVHDRAQKMGQQMAMRQMMRRARLPRLGKALDGKMG